MKIMSAEDSEKFKIRMDDDDIPDEDIEGEEETDDYPLKRPVRDHSVNLRRRLTIITVLLTFLITVLAVAGFYQLRKLHESSMMASTTAVSDLYREIETQLNTLSEQIVSMDEKIGTEIAGVEKNVASLEGLKPALEKVKSSSVSKKEHEKDLADIQNQMAALKTLVDGFQVEMKAGNEGLQKKLDALASEANAHEKTVKSLQVRQTNVENEKVDLKAFREALKKQEEQLNLANAQLKKEINSLRVEVVKLLSQPSSGGGSSKLIEQNIE